MTAKLPFDGLEDLPGYHIRRLQQVAVGIFLDETAEHNVTSVQFALLFAVSRSAGLDQRTVAARLGFDTSTMGALIDRLEGRGLIQRRVSPDDKRARLLHVTPAGAALLKRVIPAMLRAQERMLEPLSQAERSTFMQMIRRVVDANKEFSRAAKEAG